MRDETVIYAIYIRSTPEKVWQALTQSEFTRQYFWGANVESDWKPGSPMRGFMDDGTTFMKAEILEAVPGKRLSYNSKLISPEGVEAPASKQTFDIEQHGDVVRLVITHNIPEGSHDDALAGWEMSMSNLKSLLETGEVLPFPG